MHRWLALACLALAACAKEPADLHETLLSDFDGERALQHVVAMDEHVRWPGNAGFDAGIDLLVAELTAYGYVEESEASERDRLIYRVESYPMIHPAWQPLSATLAIGDEVLIDFRDNRNVLAVNSHAAQELTAELVKLEARDFEAPEMLDVDGKIALVAGYPGRVSDLLAERGALGVLAYAIPAFNRPASNTAAIPFRYIRYNPGYQTWAMSLNTATWERLNSALNGGPVSVTVDAEVSWTEDAIERTVVAYVRGHELPGEELVFSAHLQEPGANDNASGVATQLEMARQAAKLLEQGIVNPRRTLTFLWGDEIRSTGRYVEQVQKRGDEVRWGISLDMVGANTEITGGSFLIEKMPDPSAIWQRGGESFSEWGGRPLDSDQMMPHYLNDLFLDSAQRQAEKTGWVVNTNPFEGGSDHVPFLEADVPALLLWHFTDQFYHTDLDRPDKVSADSMTNVGITALLAAAPLIDPHEGTASELAEMIAAAAHARLEREHQLNLDEYATGGVPDSRSLNIIRAWADWYERALATTTDVETGPVSEQTKATLDRLRGDFRSRIIEIMPVHAPADELGVPPDPETLGPDWRLND